ALKVLKAEHTVKSNRPGNGLEVSTKKGPDTCRFEEMTLTELWAAYYFVAPTPEMEKEYGAGPGEASLLGMTRTRDDRWEFAIHPAIADAIIARDRMRLDMLIASSPKELPKVPKFETYQWSDEEAIVSSRAGVVRGEAKTGPRDILLRLRLWGQTRPGWLERHTFQEEFDQREEERARKAGLADTPAFRWARLRSKTLGALQADLSRGK